MERGKFRRLLHDLEVMGRATEDRVPARERLQRELGPLTVRKLLPAAGGRPSTGRRRDVA